MSASSALPVSKNVRLLCIGADRQLLDARRLVLESKGYEVLAVASLTHIGRETLRSFKLAILCHSLREKRSETVEFLRNVRPELPILFLNPFCANDAEHGVEAIGPGPAILLQTVARLAARVDGTEHMGSPYGNTALASAEAR